MECLSRVVGAVGDRAFWKMVTEDSISRGVLVRDYLLDDEAFRLHLFQKLIKHVSFCSIRRPFPVVPIPPLGPMGEPGYVSTGIVVECARRIVGVVPSCQVETIIRCNPLLVVSTLTYLITYLLTRPLCQLRHMLLCPLNDSQPLVLGARWYAKHVGHPLVLWPFIKNESAE